MRILTFTIMLFCFTACAPIVNKIDHNGKTIIIDDREVKFDYPTNGTHVLFSEGIISKISKQPLFVSQEGEDLLWINDEKTIVRVPYDSFMYDYGKKTRSPVAYTCIPSNNEYIVTKSFTVRTTSTGFSYTPCNSNFIVGRDGWGTPHVNKEKLLSVINHTNLFDAIDKYDSNK